MTELFCLTVTKKVVSNLMDYPVEAASLIWRDIQTLTAMHMKENCINQIRIPAIYVAIGIQRSDYPYIPSWATHLDIIYPP